MEELALKVLLTLFILSVAIYLLGDKAMGKFKVMLTITMNILLFLSLGICLLLIWSDSPISI